MRHARNKKSISKNEYHQPDYRLITVIFALLVFGFILLLSASSISGYAEYGDAYFYIKKQIFGLSIGILLFWLLSKIDYHVWRKYAFGFLIFSIFLLVLVFIPGISAEYGSSRSWINIFGHSLQPSEFVKLSFLFYLAAWLEARKGNLDDVSTGIGPFVAMLGIIAGLMILQPDIGTLSIIGVTSLIVYFIGGGKKWHIAILMIFCFIVFAFLLQLKPYQMDRVKCFMDPQYSAQDKCYQINQSLIAVGSGGFWGRGFGESRQKFMYIPEVEGDAIFAIAAEEIGLIFGSLLVFLYFYIFYRGYLIARSSPDDFGKILAIGIVSWISIQAIINIGGIINLFPITGVPLPLVSYGGSAVVASLAAFGVLVNISKQTRVTHNS